MSKKSPELRRLQLKVAMLTRGVQLPPEEYEGRSGGAGPTLGRYFLIDDDILVNAPVRTGKTAEQFQSLQLENISANRFRLRDFEDDTSEVQLVPIPQFYSLNLPDGTPMSHIALVHGTDCLATTILQHCNYFTKGVECKFCSIHVSLEQGKTIQQKTPEQFLAVLEEAEKEGRAQHLTLTIGSPNRPDRGVLEYVSFISRLRKNTDIPIHIQIEPPTPIDQLKALKEAGADTIGLHIEIFDDQLRQKFCPGKYQHATYQDYLNAWQMAVQLFGRGQVSSFVLLGLGETRKQLHRGFKSCIQLGVIPVPVPCRPNPGSHLEDYLPDYVKDIDKTVEIYLDCAQQLYDANLNPFTHRAGCIRCAGCTALLEAYTVITAKVKGKH